MNVVVHDYQLGPRLFDRPRLFHIGYDEETYGPQAQYAMVIMRQFDLWWHDLEFTCDCVRKAGCRPWMWSDMFWNKHDQIARLPKDVLQSNWYYGTAFGPDIKEALTYNKLAEHGLEQVPTFSNWANNESAALTVKYIREAQLPKVAGFLMTPWFPTQRKYRNRLLGAVRQIGGLNGALEKR